MLVVVLLDEFAAPVDWHTVSASRSGSSTAPLLIIVADLNRYQIFMIEPVLGQLDESNYQNMS